MIVQLAITLTAWFGLGLACSTLVGIFVRGLASVEALQRIARASPTVFAQSAQRDLAKQRWIMGIGLATSLGSLLALFHFWNWRVAFVGAAVMLSHLSDLLWEARDRSSCQIVAVPRPIFYRTSTLLRLAALPALWLGIF